MLRIEFWRRVGIVVLFAVSCKPAGPADKKPPAPGTAGPQMQATVVTLRTTLEPENKTSTTTIIIGADVARSTAEIGAWRLFDFKQNRVAFVDEFAQTVRYESLQALTQRRRDAAANGMDARIARAQFTATTNQRPILGVPATQSVVKLGGYQRELWFATHPLIPAQLFPLMQASETPSADLPIAEKVDAALLAAHGFPLLDHAELAFAKTKIVVHREVTAIERKNVDASLLQIPAAFKEIKPLARVPPTPRTTEPAPPEPPPPPAVTATTATTPVTTTTTQTATTPPAEPTTTATAPPAQKPAPAVTKKAPAKKAPVAKKAPAKKTSVKKTAPVKKAPAKKKSTKKKG